MAAAAFCGTAVGQSADVSSTPRDRAKLHGADTNGDGILSRMEFLAEAALRFDRMDINKDGALSTDELRAGHRDRHSRSGPAGAGLTESGPAGRPHDRPDAAGPLGARGSEDGPGRGAAMFARFDANGDGKLARDEVTQMPADRFDRLDTDHDGYLIPAELRAAAARRGRPGRPGPRDDQPPPPPGDPAHPPQ